MVTFSSEQLSDRVWRIRDPFGVAIYLAIGQKRACLMDTGFGFCGLRTYVESLTDKPVTVWLTHGHFDHASGCAEFGEAWMHPLDLDVYKRTSDPVYRRTFLEQRFSDVQMEKFQAGEVIFHSLCDGQKLDLGGLHISAFHVPGHTAGSMMFLIEEERMMLFGDACGPGTLLLEDDSPSVAQYAASLERILAFEPFYDRVLRNHGSGESGKGILHNVLEVCREVISGSDDRVPFTQKEKNLFVVPDGVTVYRAKRVICTSAGAVRPDGKEGNLSYRADKAV